MDVFFYGLFMDKEILSNNGVNPINPRKGYLNNYTLKIGNRASLIPCENEQAYGILMTVADEEISKLYSEASVADYIPEEVEVIISKNEKIDASCYNLPAKALTGTNVVYAEALFKLGKKLGLPEDYLEKISKMAKTDQV